MRIDILTTFVEMFRGPFDESIIKRGQESGRIEIAVHNLREWTQDRHNKTDDEQYGGGEGMVMLAEPILRALRNLQNQTSEPSTLIHTTPQGQRFTQPVAEQLALSQHLIILCGHYKGIDERVVDILAPLELSIGDYILTGGELPAMVITDAVVRLVPGVVGSAGSVEEDSFTRGLLDCPRYTRPRAVEGHAVPEVLLSGNHAEIERWRHEEALLRTAKRRPDLLETYLSDSQEGSAH